MSGFNPFGLSALGSMSTLGNLAQSAQRLDRLNDLMTSRPRNQNNNSGGWNRDKQRRSLDDDFFGGGGMMGGGGGGGSNRNRRSLSPRQQNFDHDDRRNQRRDRSNQRRSSRGNDNFGSSSGAGILGAAPSLNDGPSSSLSALGDLGGFAGSSWNEPGSSSSGGRGASQLNTQTQQILNMMQTQQLLAAVQAQASLANPGPPSLMQAQTNPGFSRQGGRNMNQRNNQPRYNNNRNDRPRNLGMRYRDDRKRRSSPPRNPIAKRERRDNNAQQTRPVKKDQGKKPVQNRSQADKESSKRDSKKESKGTENVGEKEKKLEAKEKEKVTNAAGEDIEALVSGNYDGKRYWCSLCKIVCLKSKNIYKHYLSKRHVKAAVEKEGKVFDPEIMKEQESGSKKDAEPQDITKLLKYVCNSRKIAKKENNDVYISSQTECTVKISDFTTKQDFMGSEFVKSISGFKCQLCKVFLRNGNDVLQHIQGKRHKGNYEAYLKDHPTYLDTQLQVNKNLVEILEKEEGKDVLLFEIKNDEPIDGVQPAEQPEENCNLQENLDEDDGASYNMDDFDPVDDAKPEDDSNVAENSQDESALDQSGMSDATPVKAEETEEEVEKSLLNEDEEEQEKEDVEEEVHDREDELLMTPSEETIPFLEALAVPNTQEEEESKETKTEKPEEAAGNEDQEDGMEDIKSAPTPDVSLTDEAEEEPEVVPTGRRTARRGRSRGRGATKSTRGKNTRRTTRGAKNVKKTTEEVPENVEEASQEMEEEPSTEAKEEPAKEEEEAPNEKEEEEAKDPNEDMMGFIDGFEVIDECVGGDDEDDDDDDD